MIIVFSCYSFLCSDNLTEGNRCEFSQLQKVAEIFAEPVAEIFAEIFAELFAEIFAEFSKLRLV
ncbi:MAG: hypothetical protein IGS54_14605 [Elainella sp. C42_A2020_010]|nr:hypothetical protein [Elainella sp. C42_A2020_010]